MLTIVLVIIIVSVPPIVMVAMTVIATPAVAVAKRLIARLVVGAVKTVVVHQSVAVNPKPKNQRVHKLDQDH